MESANYVIESKKPFSESLIWQLNRDFYQQAGIDAWRDDKVPHQISSNSPVANTYAELIYGALQDLAVKGQTEEVVYILELGAGHGRLGFHILKHLEKLVTAEQIDLPSYCYVLSDIVEDNLSFYSDHPQFQEYFKKGVLDIAYFDAVGGTQIDLLKSGMTITQGNLGQPILAIANYFFDSLPNELFFIQDKSLSNCSVSIQSKEDPKELNAQTLIQNMELSYHNDEVEYPFFTDIAFDILLQEYEEIERDTYLFFPKLAMKCLSNIRRLSKAGMIIMSMDKGYHELSDLIGKQEPDLVKHGSFSLWVNFHALGLFCTGQGGKVMFPSSSNFTVEIGCLLFLEDGDSYHKLEQSYNEYINKFGPDDFNSIKQLAYFNVSRLKTRELISLYRLSGYDSTIFIRFLPRLKQLLKAITVEERKRIAETIDHVWKMYFNINEDYDLSYELGGILYDLGYYSKALNYFEYSTDLYGHKVDIYYNQALCYYQLRNDKLFYSTLTKAKAQFPDSEMLLSLDQLDMS